MKFPIKIIGQVFFAIFIHAVSADNSDHLISKIELVLPAAVSNNAVAVANVLGKKRLFSFNGLSDGKTFKDIHSDAFSIDLATGERQQIKPVPGKKGRLASVAVTLNNRILIVGGYTVAADHTEISTADIVEYLPAEDRYRLITQMPVPVDDTVALVYQQRYIYLISGWHDSNNVKLVQVYDVKENRWFNASPYPGAPVFGHAGGIVANRLVIADGVKVNAVVKGKREYISSSESWLGEIDRQNPAIIHWSKIKKHPYKPHYRMAAAGVEKLNQIVFAGGSDNPYNYNGIGYNGEPSEPSANIFSFDLTNKKWKIYQDLAKPSMDHRGLLVNSADLYIVGGMGRNQRVLDRISRFQLKEEEKQ